MARPTVRVKVQQRSRVRVQTIPRFPAQVIAGDGIAIEQSGGVFTFSLSGDAPTVDVEGGGTGVTTLTVNGVLYGNGTDPVGITAAGAIGAVLTGRGSASAPIFLIGEKNAKAFGAAGDGAANDTAAIQSLINDTTCGTKYLPRGTYMVTTLSLVSNMKLKGDGKGLTIVKCSGAPAANWIVSPARSDVEIEGITFDGNGFLTGATGPIQPGNKLAALYLHSGARIVVKDCEIKGYDVAGLYTNVVNNLTIKGNSITRTTAEAGYANHAILVGGTDAVDPPNNAYNVVIDDNALTNGNISVIGHDMSITRNRITGWGFSAGVNTAGLEVSANIYIGFNRIWDSNQANDPFYVIGGIEQWGRNCVAEGNIISGIWGNGIDWGGANGVIANNNIYNCGNSGVSDGGIQLLAQDTTFRPSGTITYGNRCTDLRAGGARTQNYGYAEHPTLVTHGATNIVLGLNNFEGNLVGPTSLQSLTRAASMRFSLDTNSGIVGGFLNDITSFSLKNGNFQLVLAPSGVYTANRTLSFVLNDADKLINLGGNLTLAGPVVLPAVVQGDLWYGSAAGTISALAKDAGASRFLKNSGASNNPAWAQPAASDLSNGTTGSGSVVLATAPTIAGGAHTGITSLGIRSSGGGAFDLTLNNTETLSAGRTLTFVVNNGDKLVNLGGNLTNAGPLIFPTVAQGAIFYGSNPADGTMLSLAKDTNATRYLSNQGASNNPSWNQVNLADGVTGDLPFANLTPGAALTVLANATNGTADFAALAAGSDHQVLRRSGTALAFGAVNLAQSAAVTGALPVGNGGTGLTAGTSGGIPYFSSTSTIASSGALTSNAIVKGGGAGATPVASGVTLDASNNATGFGTLATSGNISLNGNSAGVVSATVANNNAGGSATAQLVASAVIGSLSLSMVNSGNAQFLHNAGSGVGIFFVDSLGAFIFRSGGSSGTALTISTAQAVAFPGIGTTASAANAFLDSGASNNLLRSTSSQRYKKDIRALTDGEADKIVTRLRPIKYRSKASADDQRRVHLGLIAEEVAAIEPRLVHRDADGRPDGVQYDRLTVALLSVVKRLSERVEALERAASGRRRDGRRQ